MGYGGFEKLRDGTERNIYVPQSKDKPVFEVLPVEIVERADYLDEATVKIIATGDIYTVRANRIKDWQDADVIYEYIGTEDKLLFTRKEILQDGTEKLIFTPGDKDGSVFEVIRVKVLDENAELKMKKIQFEGTEKIDYVSSDSLKIYNRDTVIYKYLGTEKNILQSAIPEEFCDYDDNFDDYEVKYNPDSDRYEHYPDWLGGDISEEEFWETV